MKIWVKVAYSYLNLPKKPPPPLLGSPGYVPGSLSCLDQLRDITRVKKRHIFLANLTKILKHFLSVREIFFGSES